MIGRLDLLCLSRQTIEQLAGVRDPLVTEPLLTGDVLSGARNVALLCGVLKQPAHTGAFEHLQRRAKACLSYAHEHMASDHPMRTYGVMDNVAWAISYAQFGRYYAGESEPITLRELARREETVEQVMDTRSAARNGAQLTDRTLRDWMRRAEKFSRR
jgi:hypothetical protein